MSLHDLSGAFGAVVTAEHRIDGTVAPDVTAKFNHVTGISNGMEQTAGVDNGWKPPTR